MNPLHLGESDACFDDYQKLLGNGNWIGSNLLEHSNHQNINFLVLGSGMRNMLAPIPRTATAALYVHHRG